MKSPRSTTYKVVIELDTAPIVKQLGKLAEALNETVTSLYDAAYQLEKSTPEALAKKAIR